MPEEDRGLTSRIGPIEIDWPRAIGYYGGIGLASAFELIEPPLAIFIGAIPFFKMLNHPRASRPTRFVAQLLDGAAKPVGGSDEAAFRLQTKDAPVRPHFSILQEARQVADHVWIGSRKATTVQPAD
jgi:hypothetical protein